MELMAEYPDNHFDLAIVDPPYGIDADKKNNGKNSDTHEKTSLARINTYKKTEKGHDHSWPFLFRKPVTRILLGVFTLVWGNINRFGITDTLAITTEATAKQSAK